jgi:hypothetical protein
VTAGLTAEGRREYARTEGARLKPGVKKSARARTVDEMRRKELGHAILRT